MPYGWAAAARLAQVALSRLGGVGVWLGVSLKLPEADGTIVRELGTFLGDRRALFVGSIWEQPQHVVPDARARWVDFVAGSYGSSGDYQPVSFDSEGTLCKVMVALWDYKRRRKYGVFVTAGIIQLALSKPGPQ